jgi:hypothetical protein
MKKKPTSPKPKRAAKKKAGGSCPPATCSPIPAPKLLRAESARLDVLKTAMPDAAQDWIGAQVWAYELAAAFLESLGAPEKIQGYIPANADVEASADAETTPKETTL